MPLKNSLSPIPQSRPDLQPDDFGYIDQIVRSRHAAGGPFVKELESAFGKRIGVRDAMAVSSGTSALHLALLALEIGERDEVILPSYVCAALLHAVHYTGAIPILCDIDPGTLNATVKEIRPLLTRRTRAIIVTHTFGFPADLKEIMDLGVPVIEDCALALGAEYRGQAVGSIGQISTFSFYATKVICSGEGGMVCTNSHRLASRLRDLNQPDKQRDYKVRYNYKLSDLAAGLALAQLSRLDDFLSRRREIARRYLRAFESCSGFKFQASLCETKPSYYRFIVRVRNASAFIKKTVAEGIICARPVFRPLHSFLKLDSDQFSNTASVWRNSVSVPLYPSLTNAEIKRIIQGVPKAALSDRPSV